MALPDTGFTGELVVPEDAIPQDVGTADYISTYRVADGRIASSSMFYGDFEILGLPKIPEVSIGVLGSEYIIGVGIIELYTVTLVRGEQVIVEL